MKMLDWLPHSEGLSFAPSLQARREAPATTGDSAYSISFASSASEVEEAQRLRFKVFAEEIGAQLPNPETGLDVDAFDPHCEHLLVRSKADGRVVGAYRLLLPEAARRVGRLYSEAEFDLARLAHLRASTVEAGRSCVHWEHRSGPVIMMLWSGVIRFVRRCGYEHLIGCASVSLRDGGHTAANLYRGLAETDFVAPEYRVFPRLPLPVDKLATGEPAVRPPLIKGYLRLGAKIGGAPAWDPDFNSADLFIHLNMAQINERYLRHLS